jgi:hypothetical protein
MKVNWNTILFDNEPLCNLPPMEKTAGVFMRPSDIAGHTELAGALEDILNGQPNGNTFKDQPGEKTAATTADRVIGSVVGGTGAYLAHNRIRSGEIPPPEDTKGFSNKLRGLRHRANKLVREHPVATGVAMTSVGALGGALELGGVVKRIRNLNR